MNIAKLTMLSMAAAAIAGCAPAPEPTEAELFGYRGEDAASTAKTYIVQATGVTNWVPERVTSVIEQYDFTSDELALVEAAKVLMPAAEYADFEGMDKAADEPWFTTWTRAVEAFGYKGTAGIIAHYNEDRKIWETSESYFSCYWPTREQAIAAQSRIRASIEKQFNPKKFYDFTDCWVAEYVRLSVLCAVGQKADGNWSCMLDLRDKCTYGCGPYENVEVQHDRLVRYRHKKRCAAWRKQVAAIYAQNHQRVKAAADAAGFTASVEGTEWAAPAESHPYTLVAYGQFDAGDCSLTNLSEQVKTVWNARREIAQKAFGTSLPAIEEVRPSEECCPAGWLGAAGTNALYEVRLDMVVPQAAEGCCDGQEDAQCESEPSAQWRLMAIERLQPGLELPPMPQLGE